MPLIRRTYEEIETNLLSQARRLFGDAIDLTSPQSNIRTLISIIAASEDAAEASIAQAYTANNPISSRGELLTAWAALRGLVRKPEAQARGRVNIAPLFPQGQGRFTNNQRFVVNGTTFVYDGAAQTVTTETIFGVRLRAAHSGPDGNIPAGTVLTATPRLEKEVSVTAASNFTGGSVAESDDELRARTIQAFRSPVNGVNSAYWESLATRAFNVALARASGVGGVVRIFPLMSVEARPPYGIPNDTDLAAVRAEVQRGAPLGVEFRVLAPRAVSVNVSVGSVFPFNATIQSAVENAVRQAFAARRNVGGQFPPSAVYSAVAAASGVSRFVVSSPAADVDLGDDGVPVVGTISVSAS